MRSEWHGISRKTWGLEITVDGRIVQGGSNMTGTDLCVNKPHMSRSYLNHPVFIWIVTKQDVRLWTRFSWLRIFSTRGPLWIRSWNLKFRNEGAILDNLNDCQILKTKSAPHIQGVPWYGICIGMSTSSWTSPVTAAVFRDTIKGTFCVSYLTECSVK